MIAGLECLALGLIILAVFLGVCALIQKYVNLSCGLWPPPPPWLQNTLIGIVLTGLLVGLLFFAYNLGCAILHGRAA